VGRAASESSADLLERASVVKRTPFHDGAETQRATWLEPRVKVELTYNEMMEGRLRDPVLRQALIYAPCLARGVVHRQSAWPVDRHYGCFDCT